MFARSLSDFSQSKRVALQTRSSLPKIRGSLTIQTPELWDSNLLLLTKRSHAILVFLLENKR